MTEGRFHAPGDRTAYFYNEFKNPPPRDTDLVAAFDGDSVLLASGGGSTVSAVRDGDRLLLIRYANRPKVAPYALIAGFTEIGETMEQTVRREVMEEVGLHVKNVLYYANQPWGFAGNQMVGFWADLDGDGTVTLDTSELKEAVWLCREEIPQVHDPADLTHTMTELFRLGKDLR